MVAAQLVNAAPHTDAKFYAATQTMDEARHVEVFSRYIEKLDEIRPDRAVAEGHPRRDARDRRLDEEARRDADRRRGARALRLPRDAEPDRGAASEGAAHVRRDATSRATTPTACSTSSAACRSSRTRSGPSSRTSRSSARGSSSTGMRRACSRRCSASGQEVGVDPAAMFTSLHEEREELMANTPQGEAPRSGAGLRDSDAPSLRPPLRAGRVPLPRLPPGEFRPDDRRRGRPGLHDAPPRAPRGHHAVGHGRDPVAPASAGGSRTRRCARRRADAFS